MTVLLLPFKFECLLFLLLVWLLWLRLPVILKKRGESRHPCLVPNGKGNSCSFCPLNMMLAVGLSYIAFIMFRCGPSIFTLLRLFFSFFIINGCWIFSNAFSASIDMIIWFYPSFCLCGESHFWFANVVPTMNFQNKSLLIMVYDLFDALLYLVC